MSDSTPAGVPLALADVPHELANTRRVLERVPDAQLAWKPHARSMSLGGLATHIATMVGWQPVMLTANEFDVATVPTTAGAMESRDEILLSFDENVAAVTPLLAQVSDAQLREPWTLRRGERVVFTQPRISVIRGMGINHVIHHRAQLSVYLRLLDVPVPAIYGPSADEGTF